MFDDIEEMQEHVTATICKQSTPKLRQPLESQSKYSFAAILDLV